MKINLLITTLALLLIFSCHSSKKDSSAGVYEDIATAPEMSAMENTGSTKESESTLEVPVQKQSEKIIKDADIRFEVKDYVYARKQLDSLIRRYNAYITKESENRSNYEISNTIIIRVYNLHFEKLINEIGEMPGKVDYKNINAHDVTEEFVDIEARLKTKREVETRYYDILKKANKIEDILKVEKEIQIIREEIESAEGRLKYINDRVSYSTITLNIYQRIEYKYEPNPEPNFFERLIKALHKGWRGLLSFIIAVFYFWPLFLLLIAGWYIFRYLRRKRKKLVN